MAPGSKKKQVFKCKNTRIFPYRLWQDLVRPLTIKESIDVYKRQAWPSLAELFLASLVNMVDMMMVGQLDKGAISSVNLATKPKFLIMTMVMALNTGATAVIARALSLIHI